MVGQGFPQQGHGPIEVMQLDVLDSWEGVIAAPPVAAALRARHPQPVQHGQENARSRLKWNLRPESSDPMIWGRCSSCQSRSKMSAGPMETPWAWSSLLPERISSACSEKRASDRIRVSTPPLAWSRSRRPSVARTLWRVWPLTLVFWTSCRYCYRPDFLMRANMRRPSKGHPNKSIKHRLYQEKTALVLAPPF